MAAKRTCAPPVRPLVAIIGATGTGKSQLAVELACHYNGEIINGDAMQIYEGIPIITNKIPLEERKGIPHHLLGCIGLDQPTWTVGRFVKTALEVIEDIHQRGKLPILVGGTHYYTQSLLFKDALADEEPTSGQDEFVEDTGKEWPILQQPTELILSKLREVDPIMADRWHPNDRRKIQRSLEIWLKTGKPASGVYEEQRAKKLSHSTPLVDNKIDEVGISSKPGSDLRFPTLILWVYADSDALRARLDARVDSMIQDGLLSEIESLDRFLTQQQIAGKSVDRTRGIWVSIGYKEFQAYQSALKAGSQPEKELMKLKNEAIEQTKAATRQYAKRQVRWIRIKLLHAIRDAGRSDNMFVLDGTDLTSWQNVVCNLGLGLAKSFLEGSPMSHPSTSSEAAKELLTPKRDYDMSQRRDLWERRACEACNMTAVTESDWNQHIKSRGHRRAFSKKKAEQQRLNGEDPGFDINGSDEQMEHLTHPSEGVRVEAE